MPAYPYEGLATAPVLAQLRSRTQDLHKAVEARPLMADLMTDRLTPERYVACLSRLASFHAALEPSIERWLGHVAALDMPTRRKTCLLLRDLDHFEEVASAPMPHFFWKSEPEAWGALYVVEGATLGGAVISKHLRAHSWLRSGRGRAYFAGYQKETGRMWTRYRRALVEASNGDADFSRRAVDAAQTVFRHLHLHLAPAMDRAPV